MRDKVEAEKTGQEIIKYAADVVVQCCGDKETAMAFVKEIGIEAAYLMEGEERPPADRWPYQDHARFAFQTAEGIARFARMAAETDERQYMLAVAMSVDIGRVVEKQLA